MGTYRKGWIMSALLASALLTACQEEAEPKETESKEAEQQEVVKIDVPSQESLVALANQHFQGIMNALNEAGIDFNIQEGGVTDAIYDAMKDKFKTFATASYIDGDLKKIAQEYCYGGCDFPYFPQDLQQAIRVEFEQLSDTEVKLVGTHAADMMAPESFKEEIFFSYEDGLWKINKATYEETILNLTADQALQVAKNNGYENPQFIEEKLQKVNGEAEEKVYRFDVGGEKIFITAASGYTDVEATPIPTPVKAQPSAGGTIFAKYDAKFDQVAAEEQRLIDTFTGYTTVEIEQHTAQIFKLWDDMLNEMYGVLKVNLPPKEFEELRNDQREWIEERDFYADFRATEEAGDGSMYGAVFKTAQAEFTRQRCSDFLWDIMIDM